MREIKFRAWDKRDKKFIMDYRKVMPCSYEGEKYDVKVGGGRNYLSVYVWNDYGEDCELLLYTGLKDKDGREIYEGDIVKYEGLLGEKRIGTVKYIEERALFAIVDKDADDDLCALDLSCAENIEVIGNIYENPELLEEAEK